MGWWCFWCCWKSLSTSLEGLNMSAWSIGLCWNDLVMKQTATTRFSGPKWSTHPDLLTRAALEVFVQLCLRQENPSRMCSWKPEKKPGKNVHQTALRIFFRSVFSHRIVISSQGACWSAHLNLAADLQTADNRARTFGTGIPTPIAKKCSFRIWIGKNVVNC